LRIGQNKRPRKLLDPDQSVFKIRWIRSIRGAFIFVSSKSFEPPMHGINADAGGLDLLRGASDDFTVILPRVMICDFPG
jgi:hypothetical protein